MFSEKKINIGCKFYNIPIKYLDDSLIIQTPILFMPFGKYKYGNKYYIDASFLNDNIDSEMVEFKEIINKINRKVIGYIEKKNKLIFIDSIKKSNEIYADRIKLNYNDNILIFDDKKGLVEHDYLKSKTYVKFLISPTQIWINDKKYGIIWQILQGKVYPQTILNKYSFIEDDSENNESSKHKHHPRYQKYFKMISHGVPKEAVKHKMRLDNLDPCVLDNGDSNIIEIKKNKISETLNKSLADINKQILHKFKLKPPKQIEKKNEPEKQLLNGVFRPPSISQILDIKNKLKKI